MEYYAFNLGVGVIFINCAASERLFTCFIQKFESLEKYGISRTGRNTEGKSHLV